MRERKSRSNLNCAEGGIASLALAMTREAYKSLRERKSRSNLNCAEGGIASLALAMTTEAHKSLRETKSRSNLNCAEGGIASLALAMTRGKRDCFACARNDKREGSQLYLKNISNVYIKLFNNYAKKIACNIKKIIILHKNLLLSSFN